MSSWVSDSKYLNYLVIQCIERGGGVNSLIQGVYSYIELWYTNCYRKQREGRSISRQTLKENIETLHLGLMQFCYLPGFCR